MNADTPVGITFNTKMDKASVEAAFSLGTDTLPLADDPAFQNPASFSKLRLTSMCDGRWRVRNENSVPVRFTWDVYKGNEQGAGIVPANTDVFFYTSTGKRTVRLFVDGKQQQVKASNSASCDGAGKVAGSFHWNADATAVTFVPDQSLQSATYTVALAKGIKSVQGTEAAQAHSSSFTVAPLPEPWQRTTQGTGLSSSSSDAEGSSFSLSAEATGEGDVRHFVYQSVDDNATLTARVNPLVTTDAAAKAGLMLRQSNEPESQFAFLYLNPEGRVVFEYSGEQGVQRVEGGETNGAVYLRLERKEGSVYAYESDDGVSWTQITAISLVLSTPFVSGLAVEGEQPVTAQVEQVSLQVQTEPQEVEAKFTTSVTSGTAPLTVEFDASGSTGGNLTYEWDFGDGTKANGVKVKYSYELPSQWGYFATLTVKNADNQDQTGIIIDVNSENPGPAPAIDWDNSTSVREAAIWHSNRFVAEAGVTKLFDYVEPIRVGRLESVTPDHTWVLYRERKLDDSGTPESVSNDVHLINLDTGAVKNIQGSHRSLLIDYPQLSDDGSMIGFSGSDGHVYVMNTDELEPRKIVEIPIPYYVTGFKFSPENSKIGAIAHLLGVGDEAEAAPNLNTTLVLEASTNTTSDMDDVVIGYPTTDEIGVDFPGLRWLGNELMWRFPKSATSLSITPQSLSSSQIQSTDSSVEIISKSGFSFSLPYEGGIALGVYQAYGTGSHLITEKWDEYFALDFNLNSGDRKGDEGVLLSAVGNATKVLRFENNKIKECPPPTYCKGNFVELQHRSAVTGAIVNSRYVHLLYKSIPANITTSNSSISKGQIVGLLSTSGYSSAPHLHFRYFAFPSNGGKISVLPEPMDAYGDGLEDSDSSASGIQGDFRKTPDDPYISANTLEDFQMSSSFSFIQNQESNNIVMQSQEQEYDSKFEVEPGGRNIDDLALKVITLNSEEDVEVEVGITYPSFSGGDDTILLSFRDDNKQHGTTEQEKKSKRFLPLGNEIFSSSSASPTSELSKPVSIAGGGTETLNFTISHQDIQNHLFKGLANSKDDDPTAGTNNMYDMWLERDVNGSRVPVWSANYPVVKSSGDTTVYRNPMRVKFIDIQLWLGQKPIPEAGTDLNAEPASSDEWQALSKDTDGPDGFVIDRPELCEVGLTLKGVGIMKYEIKVDGTSRLTEDNQLDGSKWLRRVDVPETPLLRLQKDGEHTITVVITMAEWDLATNTYIAGQMVTEERKVNIKNNACFDFDDGTLNGDQRTVITSASTGDAGTSGTTAYVPGESSGYGDFVTPDVNSDFLGEDADGDGQQGDGRVGMPDFRRLRNALLRSMPVNPLPLFSPNGSAEHPKNEIGENSLALRYGDFNADEQLSLDATAPVAGMEGPGYPSAQHFAFSLNGEGILAQGTAPERGGASGSGASGSGSVPLPTRGLTAPGSLSTQSVTTQSTSAQDYPMLSDFDVFYNLLLRDKRVKEAEGRTDFIWQDSQVEIEDLPNLLGSGDLEIWPRLLFETSDYEIAEVRSSVTSLYRAHSDARVHKPDSVVTDVHDAEYQHQVYTLPLWDSPYKVEVEALDADGNVLFEKEMTFDVKLGGAVLWDPSPLVLDIDDGTPDGNQLKVIGTESATTDSDGDGLADTLKDDERLELTEDFDGLDADTDGFIGDGEQHITKDGIVQPAGGTPSVDMRDFRRLRDWLLAGEGKGSFSGSTSKVDTSEGSLARLWGDYNRDGKLSLDDRQVVFDLEREALLGGESYEAQHVQESSDEPRTKEPYEYPRLTDFEVFYNTVDRDDLWSDEDYALEELPDLLESGDIEIWPRACLTLSRLAPGTPVVSKIDGKTFEHTGSSRESASHLLTLKAGDYPAEVTATVTLEDGTTKEITVKKTFNVKPGSDDLWDPLCADVRFYVEGEPFTEEMSGDTIGETGTKGDPQMCPLSSGSFRMTVEGLGLSVDNVTFEGIDTEKGKVTQEGNLITYTEAAAELESGSNTLSATITSPPVGEQSDAFDDERSFNLLPRECKLKITGLNPELGDPPVLGTHRIIQTCSGPDEKKADVKVLVSGSASGEENEDYLIRLPKLISVPVSGVVSGEASPPAEPGGSWEFEQDAKELAGVETYTTNAELVFDNDFVYKDLASFQVDREEEDKPGDCDCTGPDCDENGGGGSDDNGGITPPGGDGNYRKPVYMKKYKPKVRPKPGNFGDGWGCFGSECLSGGWGPWGNWGWGLGGVALQTLPVAKTFGDPHISTADGVSFSTMELGEFVYAQPDNPDGVRVQARQTRLPTFEPWASFNTAAAVYAGGHVYEVRLPESGRYADDPTLLIDGEESTLPLGRYTIGDAFIEIKKKTGWELLIWYEEPGVPQGVYTSTATRVRIGMMTENAVVRPDPTTDVLSLEISINTPPVGRYKGFFGTPDGDRNNEFVLADGSEPGLWQDFIEGWRITSKADSLFTYEPGEGPETYNLVQDAVMPDFEALVSDASNGIDYHERAIAMLRDECEANVEAVDEGFIHSVVIELAAGRTTQHMVDSGICLDEHVDGAGEPEVTLGAIRLEGRVSLTGHPEVSVPGATVTVYSPTLGQALCETATVAGGRYTCGGSFFTPDSATIALNYRISGRGKEITLSETIPTPQGGDVAEVVKDFEADVARVLHLKGRVTHEAGGPVANARIRVTGPGFLIDTADESGYYDVYLPLPDGVTLGLLTIESVQEDNRGAAKVVENFFVEEEGITLLERDLVVEPDKKPEPSEESRKRTLVFIAQLVNGLDGETGVGSAKVTVSAPGYIEDGQCEATTMTNGIYNGYFNCYATLLTDQPFSATLKAEGFDASFSKQITVSADDLPSESTTKGKEMGSFILNPESVRLSGHVIAAGEVETIARLDVAVSADGNKIGALDLTTEPTGAYSFLLALPRTLPASVELSYRATLRTPVGAITTDKVVTVDSSTLRSGTLVQDLEFATRRLVFTGKVVNALTPAQGVNTADLVVTRTDTGEEICQTRSDRHGFYKCEYSVISEDTFPVGFSVSGKGSLDRQIEVDPSQAALDGTFPVITNLPVSPATLKLSGEVQDDAGVPIEDVEVQVRVANEFYSLKTGRNGTYTLYAALPDVVTSGTLTATFDYVSPLGTAKEEASFSYSVARGTLEEKIQNIQLELIAGAEYDRVSIEGRLINDTISFATASEGLTILVEGTGDSSHLGKICQTSTQIKEQGLFECGARNGIAIPRQSKLDLSYTVLLNDKPLAEPVMESYDITPSSKLINRLYPDVRVNPAMLKLSGRVIDLSNQPVPQARFEVSEPVRRSVETDAQGNYEIYVPLPTAETSGTLLYTIAQVGIETDALAASYGVGAGGYTALELGTTELEFNLFGRTLHFEGAALPAQAPDLRLEDTTLSVSSPTEGLLCETSLDADGDYGCSVFTTNPGRFDLTYTLSGGWGEASYTGNVSSGLFGDETTLSRDFDVPVTLLALNGTVVDDIGNALEGAQVALSGAIAAELTTDAAGGYITTFILPALLDTADITLDVSNGDAALTQSETLSLPLTAQTLNVESYNVTFTQRRVTLHGQLTNAFAPAIPLADTALVLRSGDLEVCDVVTDATGNYACPDLILGSSEAFDLAYTATGTWGTSEGMATVTTDLIPAAGKAADVVLPLSAEPTTLQLTGSVKDDLDNVLEGASIAVEGAVSATLTSGTDGIYSAFFVMENAEEPAAVTFTTRYGTAGLSSDTTAATPLTQNSLTTLDQDLVFAERALNLSGKVSNTYDPTMTLDDVRLSIRQGETVVCTDITDDEGTFACPNLAVSATAPFEFSYTMTGLWGSTEQDVTVPVEALPALGETGDYVLDLASNPTTLKVFGTVTDGEGNAVAEATVKTSGYENAQISTNEDGTYELYLTFRDAIANLSLDIEATDGANIRTVTRSASLTAGGLVEVEASFVLENREPGQARWSVNRSTTTSALADDNTLYIGANKNVLAINPDGTERWSIEVDYSVKALALGNDGTLYVGTYSQLYAVNPDGTEQWRFATNRNVYSLAVANDGTIYVGAYGQVYAITPDGTERWASSVTRYAVYSLAVTDDGTLYVGDESDLHALNPDGSYKWTYDASTNVRALALAADGTIYLGERYGVTALLPSGERTWRTSNSSGVHSLAIGSNGTVYAGYNLGVAAVGKDGGRLWTTLTGRAVRSLAIGNDDVIYAGADNGLYAFDSGGVQTWLFDTSGYIDTLSLGADGTLYTGSDSMYAINVSSTGLAESAWPKAGRNAGNNARADFTEVPRRLVRFSGTVTNANQPESFLRNSTVTVKDESGTTLCRTKSGSDGTYTCATQTEILGAFAVTYSATWYGNSGSIAGEVPAETGGTSTEVEQALAVPLTTLRISGTVKDGNDEPIVGASVFVTDTNYEDDADLTTDSEGFYETYFVLDDGVQGFEITASDGVNTKRVNVEVVLSQGTLTEVSKDIIIQVGQPGSAKWSLPGMGYDSPIAQAPDGTLYVGSQGRVYAVKSDGQVAWESTASDGARVLALSSEGTLYAGSGTYVTAIDSDGTEKWQVRTSGSYIYSIATANDGTVYIGAYGYLYAFSPDGTEKWRFEVSSTARELAVGDDGTVYIGASTSLYAVNADGTKRWQTPTNGRVYSLALAEDKTLYASEGNYLKAYTPQGQTQWSFYWGRYTTSKAVAVAADGTVYANVQETVYAISPEGGELWKTPLDTYLTELLIGDDNLIYVGGDRSVFALDTTGTTQWSFSSTDYDNVSALSSGDGTLYAVMGSLYALNASLTGLADSSWPKTHRDEANTSQAPYVEAQRRLISFSGTLANPFGDEPLQDYAVTVKRTSGELICTTQTNTNGQYQCSSPTEDMTSFQVQYSAAGAYASGDSLASGTVSAGQENSTTTVNADLELPLTTLRLYGTVTDGSLPITDASVRIRGDTYATLRTDEEGRYEIYLTYQQSVTELELTLEVSDNLNADTRDLNISLTPAGLTEENRDFNLSRTQLGGGKWSFSSGAVMAQAMSSGGTVYAGGSSSGDHIFAIAPDGTKTWGQSLGSWWDSVSVISVGSDESLYVGTDSKLHKMAKDGSQQWSFLMYSYGTYDYGNLNAVAVTETGTIYVGANDLQALDADGTQQWLFDTDRNVQKLVIGGDGTIYASTYYSLYALNSDGTLNWSAATDHVARAMALGNDGTLYAGTAYRQLSAYTPGGSLKWASAIEGTASSIVLTPEGGLYVGTTDGIHAFDANGNEHWARDLGTINTLLVGDDGVLYAGGYDDVFAFDSSGVEQWRFTTDEYVRSLTLGDGILYVGSDKLYAVNATSGGLAASAWPAHYRDNQASRRAPFDGVVRRSVRFEGSIIHPHRPGVTLDDYSFEAHDADGNLLCRNDAVGGTYACGVQLEGDAATTVTLSVKGDEGEGSLSVDLPSGNSPVTLTNDLSPELTTFHLSGRVVDAQGQGIPDLSISASNDQNGPPSGEEPLPGLEGDFLDPGDLGLPPGLILEGDETTTDSDGFYEFYLDFSVDVTSVNVLLLVRDNLDLFPYEVAATLTPGSLNEQTYDFEFRDDLPGFAAWSHFEYSGELALSADGQLYSAGTSGLRALDLDGTELWSTATDTNMTRLAVGTDGTLYTAGYRYENDYTYALYAFGNDGTELWQADYNVRALAVTSDALYVGTASGIHAVGTDGVEAWSVETSSSVVDLVVNEAGTVLAATSGALKAINSDGNEAWSVTAPRIQKLALGRSGTVYVGTSTDLHAFDSNGTELWTSSPLSDVQAIAIGTDGSLYVGDETGIHAFNSAGIGHWFSSTPMPVTTLAVGSDGVVYAASGTLLIALATDGTQQWFFEAPQNPFNFGSDIQSLSVGQNFVYVATSDTRHALHAASLGLASSPWANKYGGNQGRGHYQP